MNVGGKLKAATVILVVLSTAISFTGIVCEASVVGNDLEAADGHELVITEAEQALSRQKRVPESFETEGETELSRQKRLIEEEEELLRQKREEIPGQEEEELSRQKRLNDEDALSRQKRMDPTEPGPALSRQKRVPGESEIDQPEGELSRQKRLILEEETLSGQKLFDVFEEEILSRVKRAFEEEILPEGELSRQKRLENEEPLLSRQKRIQGPEEVLRVQDTERELERELSRQKRFENEEESLSRQKRTDLSSEEEPLAVIQKVIMEEKLSRVKRTDAGSEEALSRQKRTEFDELSQLSSEKQLSRQKRVSSSSEAELSRQKRLDTEGADPSKEEEALSRQKRVDAESIVEEPALSRQKRNNLEEGVSKEAALSRQKRVEPSDSDAELRVKRGSQDPDLSGTQPRTLTGVEAAESQPIVVESRLVTSVEEPPRHTRHLLETEEEEEEEIEEEEQPLQRQKRDLSGSDHQTGAAGEQVLSRVKRWPRDTRDQQSSLDTTDLEDVLDPDEDMHETELKQDRKAELKEQRKKRKKQQMLSDMTDEEEDGWEQELRFRRELAQNNIRIGLERRRERKAMAEANGEMTLLQRIRQDANEILKRQMEEKKNAKEYQPREKKNKETVVDEGTNAARSEAESEADAASPTMELLVGKHDKVSRSKVNEEDELSTKEIVEDEPPFQLLTGIRERKNKEEILEDDMNPEDTLGTDVQEDEEDSRDLLTGKRRNSPAGRQRTRGGSKAKRGAVEKVFDEEDKPETEPWPETTLQPTTQGPLSEAEAAVLRFRKAAKSGRLNSKKQLKKENKRTKRSKGRNTPKMSRREKEEYYRSIGLPLLTVPDT